jgi:hypothetical protein
MLQNLELRIQNKFVGITLSTAAIWHIKIKQPAKSNKINK